MLEKKKICVLTSSFPRFENDAKASAGNFIYNIYRNLKKHNFFVISHYLEGLKKFEIMDNMRIYRFGYGGHIKKSLSSSLTKPSFLIVFPFYLLSFYLKAKEVIKKERIELIHAHWVLPSGFIALLLRKKYICTVHGSDIRLTYTLPILKKLIGFTFKKAELIITVGPELKEMIIKFGINPEKVIILPQAIETAMFENVNNIDEIKKKYQLNDSPVVLFIGNLEPIKAPDNIIKAISIVKEEIQDIKLLIIGEGSMKTKLQQMVRKLDLERNIIFVGVIQHEEIHKYFKMADLLMPSMKVEGISLVQIESIASNTPFIASVPKYFKKLKDVVIEANVSDYKDIANKTLYFYKNQEKIRDKLIKNRELILNDFSWKKRSTQLEKIYQSIFDGMDSREQEKI